MGPIVEWLVNRDINEQMLLYWQWRRDPLKSLLDHNFANNSGLKNLKDN